MALLVDAGFHVPQQAGKGHMAAGIADEGRQQEQAPVLHVRGQHLNDEVQLGLALANDMDDHGATHGVAPRR